MTIIKRVFSAEHRAALSLAGKGRPSKRKGTHLTDEHKLNISKALTGAIFSEERKINIGKAMKGKLSGIPLSNEHKEKISKAKKGKPSKLKGRKLPPDALAAIVASKATERIKKYGQYMTISIGHYICSAKKHYREWSLTDDEAVEIMSSPCYYCGFLANIKINIRNGIDRIDNNIGYIKSNCLPACKQCNSAKKQMSINDFFASIMKVATYLNI